MDRPVESFLLVVDRHAGPSGSQMGMIVRAENKSNTQSCLLATPKNPPIYDSLFSVRSVKKFILGYHTIGIGKISTVSIDFFGRYAKLI